MTSIDSMTDEIMKGLRECADLADVGISLSELDMLTIGIVNDMFSERERDEYEWVELATESDFADF